MAAKKVDFRRLRQERESLKKKPKIDSPLAKYNSSGQLFCVLCNAPVKNELLWNAHIQSKKHKENLVTLQNKKKEALDQQQSRKSNQQKSPAFVKPAEPVKHEKRKTQDDNGNESPHKKSKVSSTTQSPSLPSDFFDNPKQQTTSLANNTSDDDDDESDDDDNALDTRASSTSGLPSDFFDKKNDNGDTKTDAKTRKPSEELPEGFFDDPKLDAKARKVEYKDPVEQEWEKFQKAIQMENQVSEALVEEDDEVARIDRQLNELNEQSEYFLRAHELRDKQSIIKKTIEEKVNEERKQDDSTSSDSEEFEDFFDWRAKKAL